MSSECFIVCCQRGDGGLPKPEKAMHGQIAFDMDEADELLQVARMMSDQMRIYRCSIEVIEELPLGTQEC